MYIMLDASFVSYWLLSKQFNYGKYFHLIINLRESFYEIKKDSLIKMIDSLDHKVPLLFFRKPKG